MECIIPQSNIRVLSKALQCIAKIGTDLNIETSDDSLTLSIVNQSQSAMAKFAFTRQFFTKFETTTRPKVTVHTQSCLNAFKSLMTVDTCTLTIDEHESRVVFDIACRYGIKKRYTATYEDGVSPRTVPVEKEKYVNHFGIKPKVLIESIPAFQPSLKEITCLVMANNSGVRLKSYNDDRKSGAQQPINTQLSFTRDDFVELTVNSDVDVELTFQMLEFKAITSFGEAIGHQNIRASFAQAGRPVLFSVQSYECSATFYLATLGADESQSQSQSQVTPQRTPSRPSSSQARSETSTPMSHSGSTQSHQSQPTPSRLPTVIGTSQHSESPMAVNASAASSTTSSAVLSVDTPPRDQSTPKFPGAIGGSGSSLRTGVEGTPSQQQHLSQQTPTPKLVHNHRDEDDDDDDSEEEEIRAHKRRRTRISASRTKSSPMPPASSDRVLFANQIRRS